MKINLNKKKGYKVILLAFLFTMLLITFVLKVSSGSIVDDLLFNGYSNDAAVTAFRYIAVIVYVVTLLIYSLSFYLFVKREINYSLLFSVLVFVLGLIYLVIITPFSPPDEVTHYLATYRVSNMLLFKDPDLADSTFLNYDVFSVHNNTFRSFLQVLTNIPFPAEIGNPVQLDTISAISHSYPPEYIGPAIGFTVARLLHCNFMVTFYLGRLFGLLFFAFCVFLSVRRVPKFKLTFGLLSITPMALQQAASYSYDGFINGISLFLISGLIYIYVNEHEMTFWDYLCVLIPAVLLAPAKGVFGFIILPVVVLFLLMIPASRYSCRLKKMLSVMLVIVCVTGMFFIFKSPSTTGNVFSVSEQPLEALPESESVELTGINKIVYEPITTIRVFQSTLHSLTVSWLFESIGSVLSGISLAVPSWIIMLYILIIALSVLHKRGEGTTFSLCSRIVIFGGVLSYVLVVMVALYLTWTPYGSDTVAGIQGRYFIPVLPLLFLCLENSIVTVQRKIDKYLILLFVMLQARTMLFIVNFTVF